MLMSHTRLDQILLGLMPSACVEWSLKHVQQWLPAARVHIARVPNLDLGFDPLNALIEEWSGTGN